MSDLPPLSDRPTPSTESGPPPLPKLSSPEERLDRAARSVPVGFWAEFADFLRTHKAWWMLPILLALGCIAFAVWLSGTAVAPFIYPLF